MMMFTEETNKPNITILSPSGTISSSNTTPITVIVSTQGVYPIQRVDYYLDDQLVGSSKMHHGIFHSPRQNTVRKQHTT